MSIPSRRTPKTGRPVKQPHERRIASIRADLTVAEKAHVRLLAERAGLTEAEFLRRAALGIALRPPSAKIDAGLLSELNRIGVNVNQLARTANRGRALPDYWRAVGEELRRLLEKVARAHDP